ncbi:MAG: hypothetical protein WC326_04925 [Candidatus Delongbacteria bacterium]
MSAVDPDRLAALEEWLGLVREFLTAHPHGSELDPGTLSTLLERRELLLPRLQAGGKFERPEAEAALRLQILEEELQRRVLHDLERRRKEMADLDRTRHALKGYGEELGKSEPRPPRFVDTRS